MRSVIVKRRPDGIVQIRPHTLWHRLGGPSHAALAGLFAACAGGLAILMIALVKYPAAFLLVSVCGLAGLVLARLGPVPRRLAEVPVRAVPPPPRDAA